MCEIHYDVFGKHGTRQKAFLHLSSEVGFYIRVEDVEKTLKRAVFDRQIKSLQNLLIQKK